MDRKEQLVSNRREWLTLYAPFVFWIALILILGSGPGSSAQTSRFIKPLIEFFFPDASPDSFLIVHAIIRKTAHFVEYGILAALAARIGMALRGPIHRFWYIFAILAVVAVATIDETGQTFYSSRSGSGWDVALDLSGGIFAVALIGLYRSRNRH